MIVSTRFEATDRLPVESSTAVDKDLGAGDEKEETRDDSDGIHLLERRRVEEENIVKSE